MVGPFPTVSAKLTGQATPTNSSIARAPDGIKPAGAQPHSWLDRDLGVEQAYVAVALAAVIGVIGSFVH